jgi:hypothetical protein
MTIDKIIIEYDPDPDFSWLEEDEDREMVALQMAAYRNGECVNSLCNISFYETDNDWETGEYECVSDIPARCEHLREIARDMELPE